MGSSAMNVPKLQQRFGEELRGLQLVLQSLRTGFRQWDSLTEDGKVAMIEIAIDALDTILEEDKS